MGEISTTQISILAIGVEKYEHFSSLQGPLNDLENLVELLVNSPTTKLYERSQLTRLENPKAEDVRASINEYILNRSALGDILIFYFSGHGIPIGHSDFGFCTRDARMHGTTGGILPYTVISFQELLKSLRVMDVTPVVIIDACYSGMVAKSLQTPSSDTIDSMKQNLNNENATKYALLCSCSDNQISKGNNVGGYFSQALFDILKNGFPTKKKEEEFIFLQRVYSELDSRIGALGADSVPRLFLGETLPSIPIARNIGFSPKKERFSPYMGKIILTLWNYGEEVELSSNEILSVIGSGAYGNHSKLSLEPWGLVEDNPNTQKRRLTDKGRQFAKGEISIPRNILYDSELNQYVATPNTDFVDVNCRNI